MLRLLVEAFFRNQPVADESPAGEFDRASGDYISLNQLCLSNESDRDVDGENGDCFLFLALPDEVIGHIFSFLSIEDRTRARVNRRLNKIESEYKYYVDKLFIKEVSKACIPLMKEHGQDHHICFVKGRCYSSICIKRLTQNLSIGYLYINLEGASDFHREVYNLIKDFNIGKLHLQFLDRHLENEIMGASFFLDLSRKCKQLDLGRYITPNALHQVHKMMMEGSTKLREVRLDETNDQVTAFLKLIGVTYDFITYRFFTNRDIEGVEYHANAEIESHHARLFDGHLEIDLHHYFDDIDDEIAIGKSGQFSLKLHESKESLDEAKKDLRKEGYARINFAPE